MPFSLNPRQLLAHWVPGFVLLALVCFADYQHHPAQFSASANYLGLAGVLLATAVIAFAAGLFLDAIRNLLVEEFLCGTLCRGWAIDWDCLFRFSDQDLTRFEEFYFLYYIVDANLASALLVSLIICASLGVIPSIPIATWAVLAGVFLVFVLDAIFLRREIIHLSKRLRKMMPHEGVYTRIKPSPLHGVGVFAILDIPAGASIFPLDDDPMVDVDISVVKQQPAEIQKLYNDFCVIKDGTKYLCPTNLNRMTISWYLNDSETPNVRCADDFRFYALREIKAGEVCELQRFSANYCEIRASCFLAPH